MPRPPYRDAIDAVARAVDLTDAREQERVRRVIVTALTRVEESLPVEARPALDVARGSSREPPHPSSSHPSSSQEAPSLQPSEGLDRARADLWRVLDERDLEADDPVVGAVRAVICATYLTPPAGGSPRDLLAMFVDMWEQAGLPEGPLTQSVAAAYEGGAGSS